MYFYEITLSSKHTECEFTTTVQSEEGLTDIEVVLGYLDMTLYKGYVSEMITDIADGSFFDSCKWEGYCYSVKKLEAIPTIRKIKNENVDA